MKCERLENIRKISAQLLIFFIFSYSCVVESLVLMIPTSKCNDYSIDPGLKNVPIPIFNTTNLQCKFTGIDGITTVIPSNQVGYSTVDRKLLPTNNGKFFLCRNSSSSDCEVVVSTPPTPRPICDGTEVQIDTSVPIFHHYVNNDICINNKNSDSVNITIVKNNRPCRPPNWETSCTNKNEAITKYMIPGNSSMKIKLCSGTNCHNGVIRRDSDNILWGYYQTNDPC